MKRIGRIIWASIATCFVVMVTLIASHGSELRAPDAANGMALVRSLCSNCHVIPDTEQKSVPAGIPTFREIANLPGQTARRIYGALILPHYPMPDTHLTKGEMRDIVAYVDRLRMDKSRPPLLPARPKKKDKTDRPSLS